MSTSGTRAFTPRFADILSEAFNNCLIRPANVGQEHIDEAIRSANLMLTEFSNRGVHQYQLIEHTFSTAVGDSTYDLPVGTIDVWHGVLRRDDSDTTIWPMARSDYHGIPNKATAGMGFNYFIDRGAVGDSPRTITFWPAPDRVDGIRVWLWVQPETVVKVTETLSVSREWFDAYATNLAWRLSRKFARPLTAELKEYADDAFKIAKSTTRERADLRIRATGYFRRGRIV